MRPICFNKLLLAIIEFELINLKQIHIKNNAAMEYPTVAKGTLL
jgi:hypothetical protein